MLREAIIVKKTIIGLILSMSVSSILADTYEWHNVSVVRSPDDRPCLFFQLKDVPNVDSTGNAWFVVKQTHIGYKEILSMIISAKMAEKTISVSTSGSIVPECGHAEVVVVHLPYD